MTRRLVSSRAVSPASRPPVDPAAGRRVPGADERDRGSAHPILEPYPVRNGYLMVGSFQVYQALREILATGNFRLVDGSQWPIAPVARGHVQLRPVAVNSGVGVAPDELCALSDVITKQVADLSDIDADVLDGLTAIWLKQARAANDDATASIDDLLALRGLLKKLSGGSRGGYHHERGRADRWWFGRAV